MKNISIYTLSLIFLVACGGGGSNSAPDEIMSIGELYTVNSGDRIIKNSDSAILNITHTDGESSSTVQLIEGEATILH